jgi:hypothetical protein
MASPITVTAATASPLNLGGSGQGERTTKVVQVVLTSGSCIPQARVTGSGATPVNIPYVNRNAPGTTIAAGTAITASGIYEFDSSGVDILLALTALVATLYPIDMEG